MLNRVFLGLAVLTLAFTQTAQAQSSIREYFSDVALEVKTTDDPAEKREILDESFETLSKALDRVKASPLISDGERDDLSRFESSLDEKRDELAGLNGFERVPDSRLNAFADYVVQSMEQADQTINISLVSALLIVIIIILLA